MKEDRPVLIRQGGNGEEHQGGYSTHIRAQEKFVFHIPEQLKSEDAASM
jgi:alcohol dehydrogenase (NADP+)